MPGKDGAPKLDPARLRREKTEVKPTRSNGKRPEVSAGPVGQVVDIAFNPSREKIREVTSIDRIQGKLLPQLDLIHLMWQYVIEVAVYRQNPKEYEKLFERERPVPPDLIDEFTYRTAQWQKSIGGDGVKAAVDIALAEIEGKAGEESDMFERQDAWKE